jgi:hypothetical protein
MFTDSANPIYEHYRVEVTCNKYRLDENGDWEWRGYLQDVEANTAGIRVYRVHEGTWIEVHMLNRGVEVELDLTRSEVHERGVHPIPSVRHYSVRLAPREEHSMAKFRVGGYVTEVIVGTSMGRSLGVHLQFERR